jgi:nucleoside-diphosphate-sugar epimerase
VRILLTGASGFLGSHVADRLGQSGHQLRLLLRQRSPLVYLAGVEYERVEGDLRDPASLAEAVSGVDVVVHMAAATSALSEAEFHAVNASGTASLAVAAVAADVRRFVYVSSLAAQGPSLDGQLVEANEALPAPVSAYGRSKLAGEQAALVLGREMGVVVLRAPAVYGPRDRGLLPFFKMAKAHVIPVYGDGLNRLSWVYATDAATAVEALATGDGPSGRVYGISDGEVYTWSDLIARLRAALATRVYPVKLPPAVFAAAGAAGSLAQIVSRRRLLFSMEKYSELKQRSWVVGHDLISADYGWQPQVGADDGISRSVAWYREHGWL